MKDFLSWRRKRLAEDFADGFRFNDQLPRDHDKDCRELARTLLGKYGPEFREFVKKLASERGDKELSELMGRIGTDQADTPVRHPEDQISMPMSDRGARQDA